MEEIQYKAKLSQGRGLGVAELGNKAELDQLGLNCAKLSTAIASYTLA